MDKREHTVYTLAEVEAMERIFVFPGKKFKSAEAHFGYFIRLEKEREQRKLCQPQKGLTAA